MTPFEVYNIYLSLKQHFTNEKYDFFRYQGKVRANKAAFEKRRDKIFFQKIAKHDDPFGLLLSNITNDPKIYVKDIAYSPVAEETYKRWLKETQSLQYIFENDLKQFEGKLVSCFIGQPHQHPPLLQTYIQGNIHLSTLSILAELTHCLKLWDQKYAGDPIYEEVKEIILKYTPFIKYDKKKFKQIVKEKMNVGSSPVL